MCMHVFTTGRCVREEATHLLFYILLVMTTPRRKWTLKHSSCWRVLFVSPQWWTPVCLQSRVVCPITIKKHITRDNMRQCVVLSDMFPYCNQCDTCSGSSAGVSVMSARRRVTLRDHNCSCRAVTAHHAVRFSLNVFPLLKTHKPTHTKLFYMIQDSSSKIRGRSFKQWGQGNLRQGCRIKL